MITPILTGSLDCACAAMDSGIAVAPAAATAPLRIERRPIVSLRVSFIGSLSLSPLVEPFAWRGRLARAKIGAANPLVGSNSSGRTMQGHAPGDEHIGPVGDAKRAMHVLLDDDGRHAGRRNGRHMLEYFVGAQGR